MRPRESLRSAAARTDAGAPGVATPSLSVRPERSARVSDPGVDGLAARDAGEPRGGQAALAELRASLAAEDAERQRAHAARDRTERPVPIDEQLGAIAGEGGRLRRVVERRRNPPGSQVAADPCMPLALADFHDLRRLGLFVDDGRNPPPSWWTR